MTHTTSETAATIHASSESFCNAFTNPASDEQALGKIDDHEDRFSPRFLELLPSTRIVQAVTFVSDDPASAGEMILTNPFDPGDNSGATTVTIRYDNMPSGIRPEDNEAGTRSSLEMLDR